MEEIQEYKTNELVKVDNRTEMYLTDIKSSNLLSNEHMQKLNELAPEIQHGFRTQTIWRTETEMRCSVLNDMNFPDKASKYHQAKLEQRVFAEQLLYLAFDYEDLKSDIEIVEADIEEIQDKIKNADPVSTKFYEIKKLKAELAKKENEKRKLVYGFENMRIQGNERMREVETWSKIKKELDDGSFDKDSREANQLVSMTRRYINEGWNAIINGKNSDISSFNNIVAQFVTLVKEAYTRGVLDVALEPFEESKRLWVKQTCGIPNESTFK